ncbi:MAG: NAD-dependent succinate-semialdehyde dehydrogenase [Bacteroidia bacterium]
MRAYESVNPFTEELLSAFDFIQADEVDIILEDANKAFLTWRKLGFSERALYVERLAKLLRENASELAEIASIEMGKLLSHSKAEVLKSASVCDYCISDAERVLAAKTTQIENGIEIEIAYKPLGVILGIYPWNFPYWQVIRSAIPALMSGNTVLVKPAPNVPRSAIKLQTLFEKAGFPHGVIQTLFASDELISGIIADKRVSAVTLTGSERAGSAVAAQAGKAIKPVVLELGGSDPFIIRQDADLDSLMEQAIFSRFQNNGQSCVAAKRFIVHQTLATAFTEKLKIGLDKMKFGNPLDLTTDQGPLARYDLLEGLKNQIQESIEKGAEVLYQSKEIPSKGFFHPIMVLGNIPAHSRAFKEELFGPVLSVYTFETDEEAIQIANQTKYGLGCSIWTKDLETAKNMSEEIESGMVYINQIVKSDVRFPFGGCKQSGFGRELGEEGLKAFCMVKTRWIR